jgi:hypothetical protein
MEMMERTGISPTLSLDGANADRRTAFDRVADVLESHLDMSRVAALAGVDWKRSAPAAKFR